MTADIGTWAAAFAAGVASGAVYLALLWLSVRSLTRTSRSAPFQVMAMMLQALLRLGLVLGGFLAAILLGAPIGAVACAVIGFVLARVTITAFVRRRGQETV